MITTCIFDMDGTLINTLDDLHDAVNYALRSAKLPERTVEEIRCFVGSGIEVLIERAIGNGKNHPQFDEVLSTFRTYYQEHSNDKTRPYLGIVELLTTLKEQGMKMAIVSNKFDAGLQELNRLIFGDLIPIAIGESPAVRKKPAPDAVFLALERLGSTKEESVMIGDSDIDIMTAIAAGVTPVAVLWGFRDKACLVGVGAKNFIEKPCELLDLLKKL